MEKVCHRYHQSKPLSDFSVNRRFKDGLDTICRSCISIKMRAAYAASPEKMRKKARDYQKNNPDKIRDRNRRYRESNKYKVSRYFKGKNLERSYGITLEQYDSILSQQGGVCAICKRPASIDRFGRGWHVDHDHGTGKIRGILCSLCNWGLGHFLDDPEILYSAITYLKNSNDSQTTR